MATTASFQDTDRPLRIRTEATGPVVKVSLVGEVDHSSVLPLIHVLRQVLQDERTKELVIDVGEVTFAGTALLTEIARAHPCIPVTVTNTSPFLRHMLQVTGLDTAVTVV